MADAKGKGSKGGAHTNGKHTGSASDVDHTDDDERGQLLEDQGAASAVPTNTAPTLAEKEAANELKIKRRHRAQRIKQSFAELSTAVHLDVDHETDGEKNRQTIIDRIKHLAETIGVKVK